MSLNLNLCTSILPGFDCNDAIEIARQSGFQGIELQVLDDGHKSLNQLASSGHLCKRKIEKAGLKLPVLNTYIPLADERAIDLLLLCCQKMEVPKARVVLPRSCNAAVYKQSKVTEIIPAYEDRQDPVKLIDNLKKQLMQLQLKAYKAGVKILLELHWGTVMSSCSSAHFLTQDLEPDCIGLTLDPANMAIEGKEDWEYGLKLIRSHLDNVHVKNVKWNPNPQGWFWSWSSVMKGMVNWSEQIRLLERNGYQGDYAIEDFLVPNNSKKAAIDYLTHLLFEFSDLYDYFGPFGVVPPVAS